MLLDLHYVLKISPMVIWKFFIYIYVCLFRLLRIPLVFVEDAKSQSTPKKCYYIAVCSLIHLVYYFRNGFDGFKDSTFNRVKLSKIKRLMTLKTCPNPRGEPYRTHHFLSHKLYKRK